MQEDGLRYAVAHCPAFFEQPPPFPHIPFFHRTFTTHFNNLPVNFRRKKMFIEFKNRITNRTSQVAGLSIFMFYINGYRERVKKDYDTVAHNARFP
jgi:hypothetical protein